MSKVVKDIETTKNNGTSITSEEYIMFLDDIQSTFERNLSIYYTKTKIVSAEFEALYKLVMFKTKNKDINLFDEFLKCLPENERQHYNCHTCRKFVNKYGWTVAINKDGSLTSLMFNELEILVDLFKEPIKRLREIVESGKIVGTLCAYDKRLGVGVSNGFHHMSVKIPDEFTNLLVNNYQYNEYHPNNMVLNYRALFDIVLNTDKNKSYSEENFKRALLLFESNELNQSDKFKEELRTIFDIIVDLREMPKDKRNNKIWLYACHDKYKFIMKFKNSVLDQFLKDLADPDISIDHAIARFNSFIDPIKYSRPISKPSEQQLKDAFTIVKELGLESAFERRFALVDDLKDYSIWEKKSDVKQEEPDSNDGDYGIFSSLTTKEQDKQNDYKSDIGIVNKMITLDNYIKTVLPKALSISVFLKDGAKYSLGAFTTQANQDAKPILKWDGENDRLPFDHFTFYNGSTVNMWKLTGNNYHEIVNIIKRPDRMKSIGESDIYLLVIKDCKLDTIYNKSLALFPDSMIPELYKVRKVIEEYSNTYKLKYNEEEQEACGLFISDRHELTLRTTTEIGTIDYSIRRTKF